MDNDNVFLLGAIALIILALLNPFKAMDQGDTKSFSGSSGVKETQKSSSSGQSGEIKTNTGESLWKGKITISKGTASSEFQPFKEYIALQTKGLKSDETVNITGWSLSNNKGARYYQVGSEIVRSFSDRVYISAAVKLFLTSGTNYQGPVILGRNSRAVIVTGNVTNTSPIRITSFQVNKCSGYIEKRDDYRFFPSVGSSCPMPSKEVGVENLDDTCYKFVNSLSRCHTPEFPEWTRVKGELEFGYVDGVGGLSNQCKTFLKSHYSYEACIALHLSDSDFYKEEWRIFLGRPWELWAKSREVITLYDSQGLVVDSLSY